MMKTAENRPRGKLAVPLDRSAVWRILVQEQMRPDFIAIVGIGTKDPTRMGFAKDDDVIEAFPADRSDQPLRMTVSPW
jgi:hypothetical protein